MEFEYQPETGMYRCHCNWKVGDEHSEDITEMDRVVILSPDIIIENIEYFDEIKENDDDSYKEDMSVEEADTYDINNLFERITWLENAVLDLQTTNEVKTKTTAKRKPGRPKKAKK